jgi:L-fuculose-phosphate aldolase
MDEVSHPSDERDIRESIVNMVKRACQQGLMISSYGTISVRWRDNDFLITPTNVPRWDIQREDIVQIRDGNKEPGKLPSRGLWLHQEIYKRNPKVNSIILTQSPYLMAFGVTGEKFDVRTIPESWIFLQDVPNVSFGSHFRDKDTILELVDKDISCVIIENDSVLVTGNALLDAFDPLGELQPINEEQIKELREKFLS